MSKPSHQKPEQLFKTMMYELADLESSFSIPEEVTSRFKHISYHAFEKIQSSSSGGSKEKDKDKKKKGGEKGKNKGKGDVESKGKNERDLMQITSQFVSFVSQFKSNEFLKSNIF
jgi:hypothetical protein